MAFLFALALGIPWGVVCHEDMMSVILHPNISIRIKITFKFWVWLVVKFRSSIPFNR